MTKMPENVEHSFFRKGEYQAFDGKGHRWSVRKLKEKEWVASPAPNNPARYDGKRVTGSSLTAVAAALSKLVAVPSTINLFFP